MGLCTIALSNGYVSCSCSLTDMPFKTAMCKAADSIGILFVKRQSLINSIKPRPSMEVNFKRESNYLYKPEINISENK